MAVVFSNNATTVLSSNITNSATSIAVQDGSVFPTLSGTDYFYATLQDPGNTKREIVKVTARSGNTLTVTRAVDGSSASAFSANDAFELRLNAAALNDAVNSGTADLELNSFTGDGSEVDFTLSMEALEANTLVYIDGVYQNKTAYSISGYVLTFSAAPDNGAAIEVTTATVAPIQESTDFLLNQFTGDGSDTTFTLSSSPEENQTTVFISGVYQSKSNYSISGTTLTFSTAPPASSSIEVMVARTVVYGIGTPSNDTVSTAKIVDGAVTPAKLSLTYATETFVGTAVSNLVDSSPAALDTLNELAAALGDDPNFATTVTNSIALKAPLASPSFTGTATADKVTIGTSSASNGKLTLEGVDGADSAGIYFNNTTATNGKSYSLSSGNSGEFMLYDRTSSAYRLFVSSAGNVGIGTSSPSKGLHLNFSNDLASVRFQNTANAKVWDLTPSIPNVANSGFSLHNVTDNTVPLHVDNSGTVKISHADTASEGFRVIQTTAGRTSGGALALIYDDQAGTTQPTLTVQQNGTGDILQLLDGASQVVTVKDGGNLLVGKTSLNIGLTGQELRAGGSSYFTSSGDTALGLNRLSSDGTVLEIRKDNTIVGTIGTNVGRLSIGSGDTGVLFAGDIDAIYPANGIAARDSAIDLGVSGARFKDLYLSGGVYLGGTGAANKLDDYEFGTWNGTSSATSGTSIISNETYTKIGNVVHITFFIGFSGASGGLTVSGLPFSVASSAVGIGREDQTSGYAVYARISQSQTSMNVYYAGATGNATPFQVSAGGLTLNLTYRTS